MSLTRKQFRQIFLVVGISFLLAAGLQVAGALDLFELKAFDLLSRYLNPAVPDRQDVVLVEIDQPSIEALSRQQVNWPWPRQVYAPLFDYLRDADAVFVDILFTDPSSYGEDDDRQLAEAIRAAGNVYLPVFLTSARRPLGDADRAFLARIALPKNFPPPRLSFPSAVVPIPPLEAVARGGGNVMIKPDPDGVYRRVPLAFRLGTEAIPNFVLGDPVARGTVQAGAGGLSTLGRPLPLKNGKLLLRFYASGRPFPVVSAATVLNSYLDEQAGKKPAVPRSFFRGKKVFIGLTAAGLYDLKPTAVSAVSTGVLIHATALDNLLHGTFIRELPAGWVLAVMFVICLAAGWFVLTHHSLAANLGFFAGGTLLCVGGPALLFASGIYLRVVPPMTALLVAVIGSAAFSYATEGKERRFVRRAFAQYMDETIVTYLLKNPDLIRPGGQRRRVTVFFADIAGFTTIAEKFAPEETARILHTILNAFSEVVIANRGVIDKYIGDCIMAFWGAPLASEEDETNACRAALRCMETLAEINRGFAAEGLGEIAMRIGIHSGDAIVGNLGSDRLFDYTAVGDTVNLASRLEGANKQFRTRIMVSESTLAATGSLFLARELGLIEVKGKKQPVRIFELMALADRAVAAEKELAQRYAAGLALFTAKRWEEGARHFAELAARYPADGPTAFYREWCEGLFAEPPLTEEWNVIKLTEK